jgi:hypothetical protein
VQIRTSGVTASADLRSPAVAFRPVLTPVEGDLEPARKTDRELDSLIAEITVDCYDEDELLTAFENAFDEDANFPCPGIVIGEEIEVLSVTTRNGRRELISTCQRGGRRHELALLDIDLHGDPATSRLLAAYRRWLGH